MHAATDTRVTGRGGAKKVIIRRPQVFFSAKYQVRLFAEEERVLWLGMGVFQRQLGMEKATEENVSSSSLRPGEGCSRLKGPAGLVTMNTVH